MNGASFEKMVAIVPRWRRPLQTSMQQIDRVDHLFGLSAILRKDEGGFRP